MKEKILVGLVLGLCLSACASKQPIDSEPDPKPETEYSITLKRDVLVMMLAYPDLVSGVELIDQKAYLVMNSGSTFLYDDETTKSYDEKINHADLQDMLELPYVLDDTTGIKPENDDAGRFRVYPFFDEVYGFTQEVTSSNLVHVTYGAQTLRFTKIAGASLALQQASDQAAALVLEDPNIKDYLYPSSGTYNYRVISGTTILSMHAYGIALDMHYDAQDYWQWANPIKAQARLLVYPKAIVKIFEANGFIWGGKWNHFDIVHYEYRPEIILKAKYFSASIDVALPWYTGIDLNLPDLSTKIKGIDESLKID